MSAERTYEMERVLFEEARMLDAGRYEDWLATLSDRLHYYAPVRSNVNEEPLEHARLLAIFDDRKADLTTRVKRIRTGHAHAEQPASRVRRLISNVLVLEQSADATEVASSFLVTVSRWDQRAKIFSGGREDRWEREDGSWRLVRRRILFDLSTTENISFLV